MTTSPWFVDANALPDPLGHYPPPFDAEKTGFERDDVERLSLGRDLGRAAGSVRLGLWLEQIPPGRRTSFTHAHSAEEELVYVLAGRCAARSVDPGQPPRDVPLRAGHFAAFPAGTGMTHTFVNRGTEDALVLCAGERRRVFYPEDPDYDAFMAAERRERWWQR